jgi:hypothetical protein
MRIAETVGCGNDTARLSVTVNNCQTEVNLKLFIEGYYVSMDSMRPVLYNSGISGSSLTQCDTVWVEIHDGTNGNLLAGPQSAILQTNGTLSVIFPPLSGSHYVVVKHRNALETWTALPLLMGAVVNYDFTQDSSAAYGNNMVALSPSRFAFYSGDLNRDGVIESIDYTLMENDVLSILFGYQVSDLTGDGVVESADYGLMENHILRVIFAQRPF